MKYAIITPTYINHFPYVKKYLQSFVTYVKDKENIKIYFIISKNEDKFFEEVITPYKNQCNIEVLFCENLFEKFGVKLSTDELLKKYGRFSFQTFKKLYTILTIPEEKSLILDSESMWVNYTKMTELFENFYKSPTIYGSILEKKYRVKNEFNQMVKNIDWLLKKDCPYWFLENYMWFYEKKIVKDLVQQYGYPVDMAKRLQLKNSSLLVNENILNGIFEITLYQNYIYLNLSKYKYNFINIDKEITKHLSFKDYQEYKNRFYERLHGSCGLIEHICLFLRKDNLKKFAELFKKLHINIIRCDKTDLKLYPLQKQFLEIVQPCILAASQEHCFGINNTWQNRLRIVLSSSKPFEKLKKHFLRFVEPFRKVINWIFEPFSILYYFIKVLFKICKNFRMIIGG